MEACLAVEREQDKVIKKLKTVSGSASDKLQRVLDQIQSLKEQLVAGATNFLRIQLKPTSLPVSSLHSLPSSAPCL